MALLRKSDLKQMQERAVLEKLLELKKELVKLEMQRATGTSLASPGRVRLVKKTIAQLKTKLQEKRLVKNVPQLKQLEGGAKSK